MGKKNRLPSIDFVNDFLNEEYEMFYKKCNFSTRQRKIIDYKRTGDYLNYQIADMLHICDTTFKQEMRRIKKKILDVI